MKLCVSTLGCPDWPLEEIVRRARAYGFDALELRGVQREFDYSKIAAFDREAIPTTRALIEQAGLEVAVVGSSARFATVLPDEREANLEEARSCIRLAGRLRAPYVRVFGGHYPDAMEKEDMIAAVGDCLRWLAEYGEDRGVTPLLETHDDWSRGADVAEALRRAEHPNVGVVWDVRHTSRAGESVEETFQAIRPWIRHVHLKDEDGAGCCLIGAGHVPNFEAVRLLLRHGYAGCFSLEWEKAWRPEIAEPDTAFPHFVEQMRRWERML